MNNVHKWVSMALPKFSCPLGKVSVPIMILFIILGPDQMLSSSNIYPIALFKKIALKGKSFNLAETKCSSSTNHSKINVSCV